MFVCLRNASRTLLISVVIAALGSRPAIAQVPAALSFTGGPMTVGTGGSAAASWSEPTAAWLNPALARLHRTGTVGAFASSNQAADLLTIGLFAGFGWHDRHSLMLEARQRTIMNLFDDSAELEGGYVGDTVLRAAYAFSLGDPQRAVGAAISIHESAVLTTRGSALIADLGTTVGVGSWRLGGSLRRLGRGMRWGSPTWRSRYDNIPGLRFTVRRLLAAGPVSVAVGIDHEVDMRGRGLEGGLGFDIALSDRGHLVLGIADPFRRSRSAAGGVAVFFGDVRFAIGVDRSLLDTLTTHVEMSWHPRKRTPDSDQVGEE